ncbi:MAG: DUF3572 domain-containing protein [Notoacmeibacter sp.]
MSLRPPTRMTVAEAENIAAKAFVFLVADEERLQRFVGLSGFDAGNARQAARTPGFLAGVLSHYLNDEDAIIAFSEAENVHPLSIALAFRVIPGGDPTLEINTGF